MRFDLRACGCESASCNRERAAKENIPLFILKARSEFEKGGGRTKECSTLEYRFYLIKDLHRPTVLAKNHQKYSTDSNVGKRRKVRCVSFYEQCNTMHTFYTRGRPFVAVPKNPMFHQGMYGIVMDSTRPIDNQSHEIRIMIRIRIRMSL